MKIFFFFFFFSSIGLAQHVNDGSVLKNWSVSITPIFILFPNYDANGERNSGQSGMIGFFSGIYYACDSINEFSMGVSFSTNYGDDAIIERLGLDNFISLKSMSLQYLRRMSRVDLYLSSRIPKLSFIHFRKTLGLSTARLRYLDNVGLSSNDVTLFGFGVGYQVDINITPHIQAFSGRGYAISFSNRFNHGQTSFGGIRYNFGDCVGRSLLFNKRQGFKGLSLSRTLEKIL